MIDGVTATDRPLICGCCKRDVQSSEWDGVHQRCRWCVWCAALSCEPCHHGECWPYGGGVE